MAYANPADKKQWHADNRPRLNAVARARWKYRYGSPEKHEAYKARKRELYQKNREKNLAYKKDWKRKHWVTEVAYRIKKKFQISIEDFNRMRAEQDNKCPVCTREFSEEVFPNIDHCHNTGVVRGLLCTSCNYAEGFLRNPDNARRMYEYMVKHGLCYKKE